MPLLLATAARRWLALFLLGCLGVAQAQPAAAEGAALATPGLDQRRAVELSQAVLGKVVSDFTLQDREGRSVSLSSFRGKPLLVSFIYTGCFQACPTTTRSLQEAVESLQATFGTQQFNVVSIGFNQPADSPQSLKAFARQHRIEASYWEFLSPAAATVPALAGEFGFSYVATPAGFDHTLQVSLLDAQGRIYRQIYGERLSPDQVGEPLKQLLRNAPVQQQLRLDDLFERVRILCTVYDPVTGQYRVKYDLALEVAGGLTFALAMLWFLGGEWLAQRRQRRRGPGA